MQTAETDVKTTEASSATVDDKAVSSTVTTTTATENGVITPSSPAEVIAQVMKNNPLAKAKVSEEEETESPTAETEETAESGSKKEPDKSEEKKEDVNEAASSESEPEVGKAVPYERFKQINDERKAYEPYAKQAIGLQKYMEQNNISHEEVNSLFEIAALLKSDPTAAKAKLQPIVDSLNGFVGEKLPTDLQKRVDDGVIDVDSAKEIASLRNQKNFENNRNQQSAAQQHQNAVLNAVTQWETQKRIDDPDFEKKEKLVSAAWLQKLSTVQNVTPQISVRLAEEAWKEVNQQVSSFVPKAPIKKVMTTNGASAQVSNEPTTPEAVMKAVLARAKAGKTQ